MNVQVGASEEAFKQAGASLPGAVTIVTCRVDGALHGCTATAVSTLSLDPPLVLACLAQSSRTLPRLLEASAFAVNVMSATGEAVAISRLFASKADDKFAQVDSRRGQTGAPILTHAIAWFDCVLERAVEGGDHQILIGRVLEAAGLGGEPSVYWQGNFRRLAV